MTNRELIALAEEYLTKACQGEKNPLKLDEGVINNCLFNLWEKCLSLLVIDISQKNKDDDLAMEKPIKDFRNALAASLPKITLAKLIYKSEFSLPSIIAISAILFLIGAGIGEAFLWIFSLVSPTFTYILGIATAFIFLLGQEKNKFSQKFEDFYQQKAEIKPKNFLKYILWRRVIILGLIIAFVVFDFLKGLPSFYIFQQGFLSFSTEGKILPLLGNPYGIIIIILALMLINKKIKNMDRAQMEVQISTALINWWPIAHNYASNLYNSKAKTLINKDLARNLTSVANVLPTDKQIWYNEILLQLGLDVNGKGLDLPNDYADKPFIWQDEFSKFFDKYDYIKEGDYCFVDIKPIWKNEELLTKGLVRKVR